MGTPFDWKGLDKIIYDISDNDVRLYIAKYFAWLPIPHINNGDYLNILKQIEFNEKVEAEITALRTNIKVTDLKVIKEKFLYLFEKNNLATNIGNPNCLNVNTTDNPTAGYKITFDKDSEFPTDWDNFWGTRPPR